MLICPICNNTVDDNASFCPHCGTQFATPQQPQYQQPPQQPQYQQPPQQPQYTQQPYNQQIQYNPPSAPKKKNTLVIVLIIIGVLVLAGIGAAAEKIFQSQGYGDGGENNNAIQVEDGDDYDDDLPPVEDSDDEIEDVEYTKGSFDGTTYTNKWANITFDLPEGFADGDASLYSASENETTDCGFYFMSTSEPKFIYACFEDVSAYKGITEKIYLDSALKHLNAAVDSAETSNQYTTHTIAGETYTRSDGKLEQNGIEFVTSIFVKKIDDHIILISAVSDSIDNNNALVAEISSIL